MHSLKMHPKGGLRFNYEKLHIYGVNVSLLIELPKTKRLEFLLMSSGIKPYIIAESASCRETAMSDFSR